MQSLLYDKEDYLPTPFEWLIDFIGIPKERLNIFIKDAAIKNEDNEAVYRDKYIVEMCKYIDMQYKKAEQDRIEKDRLEKEKAKQEYLEKKKKEEQDRIEHERIVYILTKKLVSQSVHKISIEYEASKDIESKILNRIESNISKEDRENMYDKREDRTYIFSILSNEYKNEFITLVNRGDINLIHCSNKLRELYRKYGPRDREYRLPVSRGILDNGKDIIIGGDNRVNQTQLKLNIIDKAFDNLMMIYDYDNINQSDLNGIVEDILKTKFNSSEPYIINDHAINAVVVNKHKKKFSKVNKFKTIYIPCELNAYISYIIELSNKSENKNGVPAKNNKSAVLSAIVYEFLTIKTHNLYDI